MACQGAGKAVAGIYPLLFPPHGYRGQLYWVRDSLACMGEDAHTSLLAATREGEVRLPLHIEVKLLTGQRVHLGPALTTPNSSRLKQMPSLSMTILEDVILTCHKEMDKEERRQAEWELEVPEPEPEPEEEKKEEEDEEKKEEGREEKDGEEEDGAKDDSSENVEDPNLTKEHLKESKKLYVDYDDTCVTVEQLVDHFKDFGTIEDIYLVTNHRRYAVVTFSSPVVAAALASKQHSLPLQAGHTPLRLRGGSGRPRVPPRQQRDAVCPFRCKYLRSLYFTKGDTQCPQEPPEPHSWQPLWPHPLEPGQVPDVEQRQQRRNPCQLHPVSRGQGYGLPL